MSTLYLDIFSGVSGDMFIGALLDLGVDFRQLEGGLAKLGLGDYHLRVSRQHRAQIHGTKFDVHLEDGHDLAPGAASPGQAAHAHAHLQAHGHPDSHFAAPDRRHRDDHGSPHETHEAHHHGVGGKTAEQSHAHQDHAHAHAQGHDHEHAHDPDHGRTLRDIRQLIDQSALSDWVKRKSVAIFERLAMAEGKIHGHPKDDVHFHEVGAVDSIVDVVGACVALELLGRPRVVAGPVVEGTGWIYCAHGRFPLPAPATLEVLAARGVAISQCDEPQELVTPTGAAILAELAESFGPMSGLRVERIGYGLGTRENRTRPNVLRAVLGQETAGSSGRDWERDTVSLIETNLDDANAEVLGSFVEQALAQGALDVFCTPIQMKKNRPGVKLSVLCPETEAERFCELVLRETSAFGVRLQGLERRKLAREFRTARTRFGEVTVKIGLLNGQVVQVAPEYESCRRAADQARVPLKQVYEEAMKAVAT